MRIPYRRKFRRGKVTKFWLGDNNFHRRIFLSDEYFYPTNSFICLFIYFIHLFYLLSFIIIYYYLKENLFIIYLFVQIYLMLIQNTLQ